MRKVLKTMLLILSVPVTAFILMIVYATMNDYKPDKTESLSTTGDLPDTLPDSSQVNILIWNIGYCGLDKDMDFFYDGGKNVRTSEDQVHKNYIAISDYLHKIDSVDIIMLQEVDVKSKRSYRFNQVDDLQDKFSGASVFYGKNYDVFFVPLPPTDPMGSVNSGLLSITNLNPSKVERFSFPGNYAWPKRLFMLDRCFLVTRFPVSNGKELLVINTHNEAYDDGSIRDQQMAYLKEFLLMEYEKGNYLVVGGDWNQCPPGFVPQFGADIFDTINIKGIEADYLSPDWQWAYNPRTPTNRRVDITYSRGKTLTTVIDFFLLSPNIRSLAIKTDDLTFEHSDHQPVCVSIALQ